MSVHEQCQKKGVGSALLLWLLNKLKLKYHITRVYVQATEKSAAFFEGKNFEICTQEDLYALDPLRFVETKGTKVRFYDLYLSDQYEPRKLNYIQEAK